ncbi:MAG TPA: Crp/Fnr family transcriptional regulator [Casimicrobiaceae bacterium]
MTAAPPLFDPLAPLAEQTLRDIAATGVVRSFPKNAVLINEGDHADSLFIIISGRVRVYSSNTQGREFVIDFHGAGEYVGEMSLDGSPRSASVNTVEPTVCAVVSRTLVREFLLQHPAFAEHLIRKLIHRVRSTTENVKSLALTDVYGRLARLIDTLAPPGDGERVVPERLTQQDIADRVGASRDMISKLLKDLVAGGYLTVNDRRITLHKRLPTGW